MTFLRLTASAALVMVGQLGCVPPMTPSPERKPVRWIVVEKPVGALLANGRSGDGQVDPRAVVLTMQPLYREDVNWEVVVDPHDFFVEVLEITPSTQASPGETVSATVRVGRAKEGEYYRLTAKPSQPDVHIIGEGEQIVRGGNTARFRFTNLTLGRAGIAVAVEKMGIDGGHLRDDARPQ